MKKSMNLFKVFIVVFILLFAFSTTAMASDVDDFVVWDHILYNYTGTDSVVEIPANLGITEIGPYAFCDYNFITTVKIPDGVTEIGERAFLYCTSLKSITIPNSVTTVGMLAFTGTAISNPIIVNNGKTLCYVPITTKTYTIPSTVTEIAGGAFYDCSEISSLKIPDRITQIGITAFANTNINTPILINNGQTLCHVPKSYTSYTIPDTVKEIIGGAFDNCNKITKLELPEGLTYIDDYAFSSCSKLEEINIPQSVGYIGDFAFYQCYALKAIELPYNIEYIGYSAFYKCYNLRTPNLFNSNLEYIGAYAFYDCDSITIIKLPETVDYIGDFAFANCNAVSYINVYNHIGYIGEEAFPLEIYFDAAPTKATVLINGKAVAFEAYNMGGSNYFRLRDLAMALKATNKKFDVNWDTENNALDIISQEAYAPIGGELKLSGNKKNVLAMLSSVGIYLDGYKAYITCYNIGNSNYVKLRDIAELLDFNLTWDSAKNTIKIDTSKIYVAE